MSSSAPQKRPYRMAARAEAAAATRERLLRAAWQHFATRPYDDVRLGEIAADAEVTVQTLHTRFGSKDQLLLEAFIWWGQQEIAQLDTAPASDVRKAVAIVFDHYEAHGPAVLRMLAQEERIPAIRPLTDAGRSYHQAWAARTFEPLLRSLRAGQRQRRLTAIVIATDVLVWKLLRQDMQLERADAERVVVEMIESSPSAR